LSAEPAGGLAAATGERLAVALAGAAVAVGVGDAVGDAVSVGVNDRVGVGATVADGTADVLVVGAGDAVALGVGAVPLRLAQAFVSCDSTERQTNFALGSHAVPSAALRDRAMRMNG